MNKDVITEEYIESKGYTRFNPTHFDKDIVVARYQKCFRDDIGKKYHRDADVTVYRTDLNGDIIAKSDGKNVTITTKKNETPVPTVVPSDNTNSNGSSEYIGNLKSKKFHYPTCHSLPAEHNREYLSSREEAISKGYSSCGNCCP